MFGVLKNKFFLLTLIVILTLSFMIIYINGYNVPNYISNIVGLVAYPIQKSVAFVDRKIGGCLYYIKDVKNAKSQNLQLIARIDQLEKANAELLTEREKNKELKEALNLKEQFSSYKILGANVIGKDMGNWFYVFTVDRGNGDGLKLGMPVVTGKGLVGKIIDIGVNSSKITSIIDETSSVSARLTRTRDLVVLKGDIELRNQGLCRLDYIPEGADIKEGDLVETSGISGMTPKGIIIGTITAIRRKPNELGSYAIVKPNVDFRNLEEVIILKE